MKDYCKVLLYIEEIVGGTGLMVSSRVLTREEKRREEMTQDRGEATNCSHRGHHCFTTGSSTLKISYK